MEQFNPSASSVELAELVVRLPDGVNFAAGEVGMLAKTLLTGKAEERDPLKYAEVFQLVVGHPEATPWMRFACWSETINGQRRAKGADMAALAQELDRLVSAASGGHLPNTREKNVLIGNVLWNLALVRRGLRQYSEAAAAQRQSSAWYGLAGDVEKQLVGIFAAQVEAVSAAFVSGDDRVIATSCKALVAARDHVEYALPVYPGWMNDNASVHIAWALMMQLIMMDKGWDIRAGNHADDFDCGLQSRFPQWAKAFNVCKMYLDGRYEEVVAQIPVDLPSSSADNAALTVQLVVALAEWQLGRTAEAEARLRAVVNHQGPDGGIPMAVAKRLLE